MDWITAYLESVWVLVQELWLYMIIGFVFAALVEEFVSEDYLLKFFGNNDLFSLLRGAAAGFVVSACSCGAIPMAASLRNRGASTATTLTFLLASPWLGIPMMLVYVRFIGWQWTLFLIAVSVSVAITAGLIMARLERRGIIAQGSNYHPPEENEPVADKACGCSDGCDEDEKAADPTVSRRLFVRVPRHVWMLTKDIGKFLLLGILIAAIPRAFVPEEIIADWLGTGAGVKAVLIALPVSAVVEACSEGFAVIAGQLYQQGATIAVVFVMTMVGVATDYTELVVIWKKFGRRTTFYYLGIGTTLTLIVGIALQLLLARSG